MDPMAIHQCDHGTPGTGVPVAMATSLQGTGVPVAVVASFQRVAMVILLQRQTFWLLWQHRLVWDTKVVLGKPRLFFTVSVTLTCRPDGRGKGTRVLLAHASNTHFLYFTARVVLGPATVLSRWHAIGHSGLVSPRRPLRTMLAHRAKPHRSVDFG
jgi:hypothetical protein